MANGVPNYVPEASLTTDEIVNLTIGDFDNVKIKRLGRIGNQFVNLPDGVAVGANMNLAWEEGASGEKVLIGNALSGALLAYGLASPKIAREGGMVTLVSYPGGSIKAIGDLDEATVSPPGPPVAIDDVDGPFVVDTGAHDVNLLANDSFTGVPSLAILSQSGPGTASIVGSGVATRLSVPTDGLPPGTKAGIYRLTDDIGSDDATFSVDIVSAAGESGNPDLGHALFSDGSLRFYVGAHPVGASQLGTERANGGAFSLLNNAGFDGVHPTRPTWRCLETDDTNSLVHIALASTLLASLDTTYSMWADIELVGAQPNFAAIFSMPWRSGTMSNPQVVCRWRAASGADAIQHDLTHSPATRIFAGTNGPWPTAPGRYRMAFTRSGTLVRFYLGAAQSGGDANLPADQAPHWAGSSQPVCILGRSHTSPGSESVVGRLIRFFIVAKALTPTDIIDLDSDPELGMVP